MITIRNTNESYGMPITFTAETEHDAATAMETAIQECFPGEAVQITSDDYEIVPPERGYAPGERMMTFQCESEAHTGERAVTAKHRWRMADGRLFCERCHNLWLAAGAELQARVNEQAREDRIAGSTY